MWGKISKRSKKVNRAMWQVIWKKKRIKFTQRAARVQHGFALTVRYAN